MFLRQYSPFLPSDQSETGDFGERCMGIYVFI